MTVAVAPPAVTMVVMVTMVMPMVVIMCRHTSIVRICVADRYNWSRDGAGCRRKSNPAAQSAAITYDRMFSSQIAAAMR